MLKTMNETLIHQRQARRYNELKDGKYAMLIRDDHVRNLEITRQLEKLKRMEDVIERVVVGLTAIICEI
jgi:hypothetical protein